MSCQKFYFLNDAAEIAKVSVQTLHYHILQRQFPLSLFMPEREYIAVEPFTIGSVGQCVLAYEGVISLTADDSITLLHSGSFSITQVTLADRANATLVSRKYPFKKPLPNEYMKEWDTHKLGELPEHDIEAVFKGIEEEATAQGIFLPDSNRSADALSIRKGSELAHLTHAVIQHRHLVEAGLLNASKSHSETNKPIPQKGLNGQRISDLHHLLSVILQSDPKISTKHCEVLLREEVSRNKDERDYDSIGILIDISDSELVWESKRGNRQTFKLSSLGATLSSIRKRLNQL
ncbi:hypothetical protein J3369_00270 [Alteromonas sp. NFXS44]|uniref:hypothetical protein n=1 Tax=Alteromonas sp. NFXS44 TaxID=2818435 RepID=UPI0032DF02ED